MKKYAQIVNLNIVFGDDEKPMLDFFDTVIYPVFSSNMKKISSGNEYFFKNVEILEDDENIFFLSGQFVKKTMLEVKSDINEKGELIETDEKYSSAPYSSFVVNLMNHRMIYVPNQKGSPTIANFRSTLKYVIRDYIKEKNKDVDEEYKIPEALVNVVGIPSRKTMDEILKDVDKINKLTLRFYPLNGDIQLEEAFNMIAVDMRRTVDSKRGEVVFRSPKSIEGVRSLLEEAGGTINPILHVTTKDQNKATLKEDEFAEKCELDINDDLDLDEEGLQIIKKMSTNDKFNYTNDSHQDIYKKNRSKIIPFIHRRR